MRLTLTIALALLCSSAWAADPFVPFRKLFPGPRPPVVSEPLPPVQHETAPEAIDRALQDAELQAAIKRAEEAAERAEKAAAEHEAKVLAPPLPKPKPKPKAKPKAQPPLQLNQADPDYISCDDARRGATMSCFTLQMNAHIYAAYSEKKKANANACLTAAERARIAACFQ